MKHLTKRIACLLLAVVMTVGLLPVSALAVWAQDAIAEVPAGEEAVFASPAEQPADQPDAVEPARLAAEGELTIPGYTQVTGLPAEGLSGKYLIVAPYNGSYYMLYPGTTGAGANAKNSARLVVDSNGVATGYKVNVPNYDDAEARTDFSAADNTIAKSGERYSVTAGTNYKLCLLSGNPGYQTSGDSALQITASNGLFRFVKPENNSAKLIFYSTHMNFNQSGGSPENCDLMLFQKNVLPGYTQVTKVTQIKADRKYLIVAQAPNGTFYALHINADGASDHGPGATAYPDCAATLTVSDGSVSAVRTSSTETAVPMSDLLVTITPSGSRYTIQNATHALNLDSTMFTSGATTGTALELAFVTDNRLNIHGDNGNRYLTFNVNGASDTQTHFPSHPTGFCGWSDAQPSFIPIYLYIQGALPVEPGMALSGMLSGDQIGGANGSADPAGQNSWVFTGGRAAQGSFADIAGSRTYVGHFEEWVRYTQTKSLQGNLSEANSPYLQRHMINTAYEGQTLQSIVDSFDTRIAALKPRAVAYLVDEGAGSDAAFATDLNRLITKSLALRDDTGMLVIATLSQTDKTAVDTVVESLPEAQQLRVLPVLFTNVTKNNEGFPNAQGHLAMAKQLADAVAGSTVSNTAQWPFGVIAASQFDANWPVKTSVTANHEGYGTPASPTALQQAIKAKVEGAAPMTWLFMGDSITHGSAWTGGYDSLAQLFEKFVKDDLERKEDIVINAGSSGATTGSTITDLDRRLTKYDPDVVVLMLGTNDQPGNDEADATYKNNLRTLLNKIMDKGAVPIVRTPPTSNQRDMARVAGLIQAVIAEADYKNSVILVDQYTTWINSNWRDVYTDNGLHPDEAGHLWFAHQLINEMGLWDANAEICKLEYLAREEVEPLTAPVIPGYTQLTDIARLDPAKGYLIVSRDAEGSLYALYPSKDGETIGAGALPSSPSASDNGARAAALTVSGTGQDAAVSAKWLKDNAPLDMKTLLFGIEAGTGDDSGKYIFTAANGRHLNMTDQMFTEGTAALTVTLRPDDFNAFELRNGERRLDFSKYGDPGAFGENYGTDFWCPRERRNPVWLFEGPDLPTAKSMLQDLLTTTEDLVEGDYTRASWRALETAVNNAQAALNGNPDADPNAQLFADARDALRDAIDALQTAVTVPTVPAGATKIEDWKTMIPANGTTQNAPFSQGTGGSTKFRIPSIITLRHQSDTSKNGRLVAAIDARWNHTGDACALDTIASYSDDNGSNWTYNFANYFGDSTNAYALYGTAFIDPVMVEDNDGTIYLMVDIWPGGVALNTAPTQPQSTEGGYVEIDGKRRLVLYTMPETGAQTDDNYSYYVGDFTNGYAPVMEPMGDAADVFSGFYVDEYYYLYHTAGDFAAKDPANDKIYCQRLGDNTYVQQSVFFYNATLHVRAASYLWIVTSRDGGETWGNPMMINDQVRSGSSDRFYGVGPGAGLCMEDGTLLLPVYIWPTEQAGFIYSKDKGVTWRRSDSYATASGDGTSESCMVQLSDDTIRHFYRDSWNRSLCAVRYTDHTWDSSMNNGQGGWRVGAVVSQSDAQRWGACQVSVIKYSKQLDGKDLILYSAPMSGSGRSHGVIHVFVVNDDKTMTLYNTYTVDGDKDYKYSSLTETADGDIALLYEGPNDDSIFKLIPIENVIPGAEFPTGVNLTPATATIYTNASSPNHTVQLRATVLPSTVSQTVTWKSSDTTVATVSDTGLVTAVGNGAATITATSSNQGVFATCTVTVATQIEHITVKKDGADIGSTPVKVYTNAGDEDHSVTLTADIEPANATDPALNWTRPEGAKGRLTLSDRGVNGSSITVTAVPGERNVGEVTVRVASADQPDVYKEFAVHVIRKLESDVSISIVGVNDPTKAPQFGQTLEADINNLQMTDAGKLALTYQWKRDGAAIDHENEKTYTLTQADIGAVISVDVTAGANSFYEGTRSATRNQPVELADGPLTGPQGLTGTAPSGADAANGSISGFGDLVDTDGNAIYEFRLAVTEGVENEWADVTAEAISALAAGTYQVRAKETATTKAGGFSVVTVPAYGASTYAIALDDMTNGRVSRSASVAAEDTSVTLTVLPETGYRLAADGLSVEKNDGSKVSVRKTAGKENEYTFTMPGEAVTVKATFEQITFTITHELTNLHCDRGGADGHQVAYGESAAVKLEPDEGYVLPLRKDITITNSRGVAITGWTISDDGTITITGGVTSDLYIVAVGRPASHTVNYTLTNGLKRVDAPDSVDDRAAYEGVLGAEDGYKLPETIIVTVGGSLIGAENYLYNKDTGEISISEGKITGNVVITAVGVKTGDETVSVTGVTLNRTEANVTVGGVLNLTATVTPNTATNKTVVWATEDEAIATVDENGKVTAVAEGSTTITVMTLDGRYTAVCTVTVTKAGPSRPSGGNTSTTTETKDDGTKVTTVTKPDGTKTETTETPDGTVAVVETKPDGSKTQTVEQPDGTKSELTATKDGDVTITVTDKDGEELVKTEIPATIPEPETKFVDLAPTPWADEAIHKMAGLELVEGTGDNKYSPVASMTRGSLATVLHRLSQGKTDYETTFKDVAETKFYAPGVAWAAKAGVVTGYTADTFAPEDIITREQLAVMLARYAKLIGMNTKADSAALAKFNDGANTGSWAVDGMAWCVENGIIRGKDGNRLDPTTNVSRAEVAVMLDRFIELLK